MKGLLRIERALKTVIIPRPLFTAWNTSFVAEFEAPWRSVEPALSKRPNLKAS
jgi:hypothetical protein